VNDLLAGSCSTKILSTSPTQGLLVVLLPPSSRRSHAPAMLICLHRPQGKRATLELELTRLQHSQEQLSNFPRFLIH
jgi:hypothetical protein